MKSKWYLTASIIQLVVGILAIIVFIIMAMDGEIMTKWILTMFLAILYVILGITGIIDYKKQK